MLRRLLAGLRPRPTRTTDAPAEFPLETEEKWNRLHAQAPVDAHLEMLFEGCRVGAESYVDLYRRCLRETGTVVTPFNVFHRFQTRHTLLQYLSATASVPGARIECGAYRGATALLLCRALQRRDPGFSGRDFYLLDSFSGVSRSVEHDLITVRGEDGTTRREAFFPAGRTDTSAHLVRGYFHEFPDAQIVAGWIPEVFARLPEDRWAFVHLDLTLYEPTLASLAYFHPRMSPGGVILCAGSIFCPGVERAFDEYCTANRLAYVQLAHRFYALIR
jgi:O-methyltransferase